MPKHRTEVKWLQLTADLEWRKSVLELKRYALIVVASYPNRKVRESFMQYYFGESMENRTGSFYNNNVTIRDAIKAVYDFQNEMGLSADQVLDKFLDRTDDELMSRVLDCTLGVKA